MTLGGEYYKDIVNIRTMIPNNPKVKDIGLGFLHTIVLTDF